MSAAATAAGPEPGMPVLEASWPDAEAAGRVPGMPVLEASWPDAEVAGRVPGMPVLDASWPGDQAVAETLPLPARLLPRKPGLLRGAGRGMLVNPWFAAGTGFVIAAAMWMYSPHAELQFPPGTQGGVRCADAGCVQVTPSPSPGSLAGTNPQRIAPSHRGRPRPAASGLTFSFMVLWKSNGMFGAKISVNGKHSLGTWRLKFTMPGDQIKQVWDAAWQPSPSGDGGTASPSKGAPESGMSYGGQEGHTGRSGHDNEIVFFVFGAGTPAAPTGCFYDGASCKFS